MFPQMQGNPQTGQQPPTSAAVQQSVSLLGNTPYQSPSMNGAMPTFDPGLLNSTAPQSSNVNPGVAGMVKALKGTAA